MRNAISRLWPPATALCFLAIFIASLTTEIAMRPGYDFAIFLAAGASVLHGLSPYVYSNLHITEFLHHRAHGLLFPYLPWVAFVFAPLSPLGLIRALVVWDILLAIAMFGATFVWARSLNIRHPWFVGALAVLSAAAVHNYGLGQVSIFCLGFIVGALLAARKGNMSLAGALAVAAALLKPQDALVAPILVLVVALQFRGLRKAIAGEVAAALTLLGLPLLAQPSILINWIHFELAFVHIPNPGGAAGIGLTSIGGWVGQTPMPSLKLIALALLVVAGATAGVILATRREGLAARSSWIILAPLTVWLLLTPDANQQDVVLVIPMLLLLIADIRLSLLNRTLLVAIAIVATSTQEILMPRISMAYDIDVVVLAALVMEIFVAWWPRSRSTNLIKSGDQ